MANLVAPSGVSMLSKVSALKASLMKNAFNFIHINPGSLKPHLDEVRSLISDLDLHMLAVSETWFSKATNDKLVAISGFTLLRHDRMRKRAGGVAIYLRSGIKFKILHKSHQNAHVEFFFLEIDNNDGTKFAA